MFFVIGQTLEKATVSFYPLKCLVLVMVSTPQDSKGDGLLKNNLSQTQEEMFPYTIRWKHYTKYPYEIFYEKFEELDMC